jgi:hypothetical protein
MNTTWIIIAVVALVVFYFIYLYNNFVKLVQQAKEAWADIDVQLKRRYDLIPNLIETVKGYAAHERETLDAVTQARTTATQTHIDAGAVTAEHSGSSLLLLKIILILRPTVTSLNCNENFLIQKTRFRQLAVSTMEMSVILILLSKLFRQVSLVVCSTSKLNHSSNFQKIVLNANQ